MMRMKFETYWILLLAAFLGGWIAPALAQIKSAERIPFGHTVSLVPDTGIPSLISVVNTGDAPIAKVRAIFLIDGQFLSVPSALPCGFPIFPRTVPYPEQERFLPIPIHSPKWSSRAVRLVPTSLNL